MDNRIRYYKEFRKRGFHAAMAWSNARIMAKWEDMESEGFVRLQMEPERESYFTVYGKPDSEKERREIESLIDRHGCWYVYGEYRCNCCGSWNHGGSIGMIIDSDPLSPFSNVYVPDIAFETMRSLSGHESNGKSWRVF